MVTTLRKYKKKLTNMQATANGVIKFPINWNGALSVFMIYTVLHLYIKAKKTETDQFSFCW